LSLTVALQACVTRADLDAEQRHVDDANKAVAEKDWPQARVAVKAYVGARAFSHLSQNDQFGVLRMGASIELKHGDKEVGYGYLLRAVEKTPAGQQEWLELTGYSVMLNHPADTARGLVVLAQRWPSQIDLLHERVVGSGLQNIHELPPERQLSALWDLYTANFTLKWGFQPNEAWRDLCLLLLQQNRLNDAIEVSRRIASPEVLIEMRADLRFDAVVTADPGHFDIEDAAKLDVKHAQQISDAHPTVLALKVYVAYTLLRLRDFGAMLAATDEVVSEVASTNFPQRIYTDFGDQYRSLLEARSTALERLGRLDDAVKERRAASRLTEEGLKNVSQAIDLGELYCRLNRPKDALTILSDVGALSDFGSMQLESVRLRASLQLHDDAQVADAMKFLAQHRADAPLNYEQALVRTGQMDAAARSLIARLMDPKQRLDALRTVQDFPVSPGADSEHDDATLWKPLIARGDVQAAIRKVGRAEGYLIEPFE
jgi:tetratricopeptide (TPR) repeat protein